MKTILSYTLFLATFVGMIALVFYIVGLIDSPAYFYLPYGIATCAAAVLIVADMED